MVEPVSRCAHGAEYRNLNGGLRYCGMQTAGARRCRATRRLAGRPSPALGRGCAASRPKLAGTRGGGARDPTFTDAPAASIAAEGQGVGPQAAPSAERRAWPRPSVVRPLRTESAAGLSARRRSHLAWAASDCRKRSESSSPSQGRRGESGWPGEQELRPKTSMGPRGVSCALGKRAQSGAFGRRRAAESSAPRVSARAYFLRVSTSRHQCVLLTFG
jgi:hypothetical protein